MRRGILATRDELSGLRERIARKPCDALYDRLQKRCSMILEAAPLTEPHWVQSFQQGDDAAALRAVRSIQGRVIDLLIAHHIDPNRAYHDRAVEELAALCGWSAWTGRFGHGADIVTSEAVVAAVLALDWLWEDLSQPQRIRVQRNVMQKALQPYLAALEEGTWWYHSCTAWNAVINGGLALASTALKDEPSGVASEVADAARKGLEHFFNGLGREGGWEEGIGYWAYAMRYVLLAAEGINRLEDDQTLLHQRGMDATGLFPVYFTPNGRAAGFGTSQVVPLFGAFYLLSKHYVLPEVTWWLDTYAFGRDVSVNGWSDAGLALLLRPREVVPDKTKNLQPVKVFHQIGWAALADSWPKPTFYASAKTGDLSAAHSRRDMNTIQLQVDGEMLLIDPVWRPRPDGFDSLGIGRDIPDLDHNTARIAERDQMLDAQGRILEAEAGRDFRWVCCDAGAACGEDVRFHRHVVMLLDPATPAERALVVVDDFALGSPEKLEIFWHTRGQIDLNAALLRGRIKGIRGALDFAIAGTVNLSAQAREVSDDDRLLHVFGGAVGPCTVATIFSRRALGETMELTSEEDRLTVAADGMSVRFAREKGNLSLEKVERN